MNASKPASRSAALRPAVLMLVAVMLLSGCAVLKSAKSKLGMGAPPPALRSLSVSADPGANQGSATQLDIVVVYSTAAAGMLPKTGPDWFRQRAALQSALAKDIEVVSLQVQTPSAAFKVKLPKKTRKKGLAVYAFANYVSPDGWPLIALTPYKKVTLRLQANAIAISEP